MTYLFNNNAIVTNEVEIKNDAGNPLPVVGVASSPLTVTFKETSYDGFGRMRTSQPHTIWDSTLRYSDDSRNWDTSNVGVSANTYYSVNTSSMHLNVGTASGEKTIRQTKRYFQYLPGKSLLSLNTGVFNTPKPNLTQRIGYFDQSNGIYFENDGTTNYIVKRSNTTGTVTETRVPQTNWSEDKLDGSGASDVNMNIAAAQIFWTDIEWLGVGTVRAGVIVDGEYIVAHKFHHANIVTDAYMTTASLPVRYEIENTGITSSSSTLKQICSSIISEGGYTPTTQSRSVSTPITGLEMSQTTFRPLIAVRLKQGRQGGIAVPSSVSLFGLQTTPFIYRLVVGASVTGGLWLTSSNESHVEYNANATAYIDGRTISQGLFTGGTGSTPLTIDLTAHNHSLQLKTTISGTNEVFLVGCLATTNNDDALCSLDWQEFN